MSVVSLRTGSLWLWFLEIYVFSVTSSTLFSSVQKMESLYHQENSLLSLLESFINSGGRKVDGLERKFEKLKRAKAPGQSAEDYISHPVNSFTLLRRMTLEWPLILNMIADRTDIPEQLLSLPGQEDIKFAFKTISWLQTVYKLDSEDLVKGTVVENLSLSRMTALDCFEMGKYCYSQNNFALGKSWFNQALELISNGDLTANRHQVLPYLYLASTFLGCMESYHTAAAESVLTQLLAESPDLVLSAELSHDFGHAIAGNCSWVHHTSEELVSSGSLVTERFSTLYGKICSGQADTPTGLMCHYVHYHNPRLLLAPFKLEEIYLDPPIVMFHNVISDKEVEKMMALFLKNVSVCLIKSNNTFNSGRLCEVNWMEDEDSETAARISRRVADMTDLHGEGQDLQVARYGLGGEFRPHMDHVPNKSLSPTFPDGNRIASLMFYLNDVEYGGRTVFPRLNISITPIKGSAVHWFNLNHKGEGLPKLLHAGCPVLKGQKIVLNKWLLEKGQDNEKTCPKDEIFPKKLSYL